MAIEEVGRAREPVIVIDDFAPKPEALRAEAGRIEFSPGINHYPGIRAPLSAGYLEMLEAVAKAHVAQALGGVDRIRILDASYSIVTTPPDALTVAQRLPHCDAFERNRFAMVHYLSSDPSGTAFFRHRSTGFETIDRERAGIFFPQLEAEIRYRGPPAPGYVSEASSLFERIFAVPALFNRAVFYRSWLLHSGDIAPQAGLSPDPVEGRLTITAFFSAE